MGVLLAEELGPVVPKIAVLLFGSRQLFPPRRALSYTGAMWGLLLTLATASPPPLVCTGDIQDADFCDAISCFTPLDRARCPQTCGHACTFCDDTALANEAEDCNFSLDSADNLSHFEDLCRSAYVDIGGYANDEPVNAATCTCICQQFWAARPQYCTDPVHPAYNERLNGFDDDLACEALIDAGVLVTDLCADPVAFAVCPSVCGHACTFCNADVLAAEDDLYNCTELETATDVVAACLNKTYRRPDIDVRYSVCSCTCRDALNFTVTTTTPTTPTTPTATTPASKRSSPAVPIALGVTAAVLITAVAGGWYFYRRTPQYNAVSTWL